ncbi:MAG: ClpXP protease specificity-enhancing factor [Rhodobacter sp.]|nr:ClpXP protease specificity-enhancing factor [Rhodobacter sp.]
MTSSKPYLLRALYEWILDNESTPYILVDTSHEEVAIPPGIASDGKVVLNLAPQAIQELEISNDSVSFSARFGGVPHDVYCPMTSLLAIYARETGEGMMFPAEDAAESDDSTTDEAKPAGPILKIIK